MAFVLDVVWEWVLAHVLGKCVSLQVPDDVSLYADPEMVYEFLFADGVRNWGRKMVYVAWLKESFGTSKTPKTRTRLCQCPASSVGRAFGRKCLGRGFEAHVGQSTFCFFLSVVTNLYICLQYLLHSCVYLYMMLTPHCPCPCVVGTGDISLDCRTVEQ